VNDEGPALYRPSYAVLPDEADTLDGRRKLAREDVTRFGEELDTADVPLDGVKTGPDVQAPARSAACFFGMRLLPRPPLRPHPMNRCARLPRTGAE
jgi:hypothetical protein